MKTIKLSKTKLLIALHLAFSLPLLSQAADLNSNFEAHSKYIKGNDLIYKNGMEALCGTSLGPEGFNPVNLDYLKLNNGFEFGVTDKTDILINLFNTQYAQVSNFTYPDTTNFRRRIDFVSPPTLFNEAAISTVSISECPGDFSESAACVQQIESFQVMRFSNNPNDNPLLFCILDPAKIYYMNVMNSSSPYTIDPLCLDMTKTNCAINFIESAQ